ncbi:Protoheme IX farnesyltransferase [Novosphingobium lubricantis]|jgi:hypothetical protein
MTENGMNKPGVERQSMDAQQTELYRARQRSRNKVLALILGALAVLFFAITIVKITAQSGAAG